MYALGFPTRFLIIVCVLISLGIIAVILAVVYSSMSQEEMQKRMEGAMLEMRESATVDDESENTFSAGWPVTDDDSWM